MIINPLEVSRPLCFSDSWFCHRFHSVRLDYIKDRYSQYKLDDCIQYAENYKSNSKNPKQKEKSEAMMKQALEYMKGMR
jgi:hypothetical protein